MILPKAYPGGIQRRPGGNKYDRIYPLYQNQERLPFLSRILSLSYWFPPDASHKNIKEMHTMPQVEIYTKLLEGFVLLSIPFLASCFREFNLSSLFCNLVIFLFSSAGFSIAY